VELGETVYEAGKREVHEETAVEIKIECILDIEDFIQRDKQEKVNQVQVKQSVQQCSTTKVQIVKRLIIKQTIVLPLQRLLSKCYRLWHKRAYNTNNIGNSGIVEVLTCLTVKFQKWIECTWKIYKPFLSDEKHHTTSCLYRRHS
jgi:8-oxo-dGTP pyrophosphatase MutT (NUDIX family)